MRRLWFVLASSALASALALACAKDDEAPGAPRGDGGLDAALIGETAPPDPDADVPLGDVCGDPGGLQPNAVWPLKGGCPKRASYAGRPGPQNATIRWSTPIAAAESSPAITADGTLWVGTADGDVVAIAATNGNVLSALRVGGGAVRSSPAIDVDGVAVIGGGDGLLYGVVLGGAPPVDAGADADAGEDADAGVPPGRAVRKVNVDGPIASSPVIAKDGTAIVATTNGKVVAVSADGAVKWSVSVGGDGASSPAIGRDGRIYVGGANQLHALEPEGGGREWTYDVGAIAGSPVVGGDDTIYVGASDGKLHAVAPDGKGKWTYAAGGPITGAPAVAGGVVYVGAADKKLHAVGTPDGKKKWEYATLGDVATPIVTSDGNVYVAASDGYLYALRPTGLLYFAASLKGKAKGAPALGDDGTLYVTTDTGIVAVGP